MNIFKWLADKAGKMAPLQMAGLGGLSIVAAGAVAVSMFSPSDNNTSFNLDQLDDRGELAYVANSGGGSYAGAPMAGASGGVNGQEASSVRLSARTLGALNRYEARESAASEMIANDQEAFGKGYDMASDTTGLGLTSEFKDEKRSNDPMAQLGKAAPNGLADMSGMMAGMKGAMSGVQGGGAEGGAQGAEGGAAGKDAPPQLAAASKDWSSSAATKGGGGHGNAFASSYVKMDSGKNKKTGDVMAEAGAAIGNLQNAVTSANERVARMKNNSSFGNSVPTSKDFEASASGFGKSIQGRDLAYIRDATFKSAATNTRSAVDAMGGFLSSDKVSGGIMVNDVNFQSGSGHSSSDFNSLNENSLRGINTGLGVDSNMMVDVKKEVEARKKLETAIWVALPIAMLAMVAAALLANIAYSWFSTGLLAFMGIPFMIAAVAVALAGLIPVFVMMGIAGELVGEYGKSNLTTFSFITGGVLTAAMGLAFVPAVGKFLGQSLLYTVGSLVLAPLIGAGIGWSLTSKEGPTETVQMTPEEAEEYYKNHGNG